MSITTERTVTLAEASIDDDYGVSLVVEHTEMSLTPDQALALADELSEAAVEASRVRRADSEAHTAAHGFDVAPVCRECAEGKHGACNGQALIETGDAIELHACGCSEHDHRVHGRAPELSRAEAWEVARFGLHVAPEEES